MNVEVDEHETAFAAAYCMILIKIESVALLHFDKANILLFGITCTHESFRFRHMYLF